MDVLSRSLDEGPIPRVGHVDLPLARDYTRGMGLTYATLEVINAGDLVVARRKLMPEENVRRESVRMLASE